MCFVFVFLFLDTSYIGQWYCESYVYELKMIISSADFIALLDNYSQETGVPEEVTEEEIKENWTFLNACMETDVRLCKFVMHFVTPYFVTPFKVS